jgi:hypothetical protein
MVAQPAGSDGGLLGNYFTPSTAGVTSNACRLLV